MAQCLFCRIVQNEIPATRVYEDKDILVFNDIHPKAPTHWLAIPKMHIATLHDAEEHSLLLGKLMQTASRLAKEHGFSNDGYRVVMNCNTNGGQEVYHMHLHILAGRQMTWPPG